MGARYSFVTQWRVWAPPERAWEAIAHPLSWPEWWKGVLSVEELAPAGADGLGAVHRYTWKSALPYRLVFDMRVTLVDEPAALEGRATGELEGTGRWTFTPEGEATLVRYDWEIETTRRWMNALAPLLRPAFAWNHDYVMRSGARGLERRLGARVESIEGRRPRRLWKRALAGAFAAVGGLALLTGLRRARA